MAENGNLLNDADPLLTRSEIVGDLRDLGVPISASKFEKLCMAGLGPPVECYWGKRPLTRRSHGRAWAERRMRKRSVAEQPLSSTAATAVDVSDTHSSRKGSAQSEG